MKKKLIVALSAVGFGSQSHALPLSPTVGGTQYQQYQIPVPFPAGCLDHGLTPNGGAPGVSSGIAGADDSGGNSFPLYSTAFEFDLSDVYGAPLTLNLDWKDEEGSAVNFCVITYTGDGQLAGTYYSLTRSVVGTFLPVPANAFVDQYSGHISMALPRSAGILGVQIAMPGWYSSLYQFSNVSLDVPEPAMLGLFGLGAVGLGLSRRRNA